MYRVTWLSDVETVTKIATGEVTKAERRVSTAQCYTLVDAMAVHNAMVGYYGADHVKLWGKGGQLIRPEPAVAPIQSRQITVNVQYQCGTGVSRAEMERVLERARAGP